VRELTASKKKHASDDLRIARAAASGDRGATRQLAGRLLERVRTTVRYLSGDHRDQDDFVQLSLLQIVRSAGKYEGRSSLEAWADRIVVRTTMRHLRRSREKEARYAFDAELDRGVREVGPDEHSRQLMRRQLSRAMQRLSAERRTAIVLRMVHGYGVEEIAEITGARVNTVRDRLARGRRQLKGMLEKDPVFAAWSGV